MAAKAAVHGAPRKAFSRNASDENERWRWTEDVYQRKNNDIEKNNNYDWNRRELNFEINQGKMEKLGSNELRLHERLQRKLDELDFKTYKDDAQNKPNCCVDWVFSGDHDRMCEMAFGKEHRNIDFSLKNDNTEAIKKTDAYKYHNRKGKKKPKRPEIHNWALEVYKFACRKWGEENIIGMEVHLDETTPHAHVLMVPVAERKSRGRQSTKYEKKDDPSVTILKKDYEQLSEAEKTDYQPVSKRSKRLVSYSGVFGDNYPERKEYMKQFHTDFYEQVGRHFGLERGDDLDLLDPEERRKRRHMRKDQLHTVQEHERKVEELSRNISSLQEQNGKLKEEHANLTERIKALPSTDELEALEIRSKALQDEIVLREERLMNLPSLESIVERENRHKAIPSLDDIIKREKKFKANKLQLVKLLSTIREELEEQKDYSSLGELNKLGNIKDDVEWFNAASKFVGLRNQKLLEEEEKLRQKINTSNDKLLILTNCVNNLKKEETQLSKNKRAVYQSSVLPVVGGGIEVVIEKSQDDDMCVFVRVGDKWLGKKLTEGALDDYRKNIATKEQIAAIYLTSDILDYVKEKKVKETSAAVVQSRRSAYEGLILPNVGVDIKISVEKVDGREAIFANIKGEDPRGYYLSDVHAKDYRDGVASKEQLGALLLSGDIIRYVSEKRGAELDDINEKLNAKKVELANIHVPTKAEIEAATSGIINARKKEYAKLVLPKIRGKIEVTISRAEGDAVNIYFWAKVDDGKWHREMLTKEQYKDYFDGIVTKEQLAALLLSEDIINDATEQAHKKLMNFEEKPWNTELSKRTISLFGGMGESIKQTISDLDDMTREMHPNPTKEQLNRLNMILDFIVETQQSKDRRDAAKRLCDIAIPLSRRCDGLWREHVVDIVKKVAEQGPDINLQYSRGRSRGW